MALAHLGITGVDMVQRGYIGPSTMGGPGSHAPPLPSDDSCRGLHAGLLQQPEGKVDAAPPVQHRLCHPLHAGRARV